MYAPVSIWVSVGTSVVAGPAVHPACVCVFGKWSYSRSHGVYFGEVNAVFAGPKYWEKLRIWHSYFRPMCCVYCYRGRINILFLWWLANITSSYVTIWRGVPDGLTFILFFQKYFGVYLPPWQLSSASVLLSILEPPHPQFMSVTYTSESWLQLGR